MVCIRSAYNGCIPLVLVPLKIVGIIAWNKFEQVWHYSRRSSIVGPNTAVNKTDHPASETTQMLPFRLKLDCSGTADIHRPRYQDVSVLGRHGAEKDVFFLIGSIAFRYSFLF